MHSTKYIQNIISVSKAGIDRELAIIAADCADPKNRVGCDRLTLQAVERLAQAVKDLADIRSCFVKVV